MSDKAYKDMSRGELEHMCRAFEHLTARARGFLDDVLLGWPKFSDEERLERTRRVYSPLLINPRPLDDETVELLRRLTERQET